MNDLIQDLALIKENAKLSTSRLKEWHLSGPTCKVYKYRKRRLSSLRYFSDIPRLFNEIGIDYNPLDWRLCIDSSVKSLKAVLLHNGNKFSLIPVGHSVHMKKEYENVKSTVRYDQLY